MTEQEFDKIFQVKVTKQILKDEFPWIVGFKPFSFSEVSTDERPRWSRWATPVYLNINIDLRILAEEHTLTPLTTVTSPLARGQNVGRQYLAAFFEESQPVSMRQTSLQVGTVLHRKALKIIDGVESSPALPKIAKLPDGMSLGIGEWFALASLWT